MLSTKTACDNRWVIVMSHENMWRALILTWNRWKLKNQIRSDVTVWMVFYLLKHDNYFLILLSICLFIYSFVCFVFVSFSFADTKNSVGLVGCIEEVSHNAIAVYWNPLESSAKVSHTAINVGKELHKQTTNFSIQAVQKKEEKHLKKLCFFFISWTSIRNEKEKI